MLLATLNSLLVAYPLGKRSGSVGIPLSYCATLEIEKGAITAQMEFIERLFGLAA
jgi:hypothetical protein